MKRFQTLLHFQLAPLNPGGAGDDIALCAGRRRHRRQFKRGCLAHGTAVQVDSISTRAESAAPMALALDTINHKLLSTFAFKFNLRRYVTATIEPLYAAKKKQKGESAEGNMLACILNLKVGRRRSSQFPGYLKWR